MHERPAGLSQERAAQALGIALRTYARWVRPESFGYLTQLPQIARAFSVSESDLLGGEATGPKISRDTLTTKLDQLLAEVRQIREDLAGSRRCWERADEDRTSNPSARATSRPGPAVGLPLAAGVQWVDKRKAGSDVVMSLTAASDAWSLRRGQ
jgi:transcriptional regulator with XRE-family HTH domain